MIGAPLALPLLAGSGLYAAWSDIRYRRLSNGLVALTATCGLGLMFVAGGMAAGGSSLLHAVTALLIGVPLFALKVVGGGDVKYYAAVAAWFPFDQGFRLLASVSLAGMVLALWWLILRRSDASHKRADGRPGSEKVPFGVAIACGAIIAALAWPQ